ncbi:MAG TPA: YbjN domain-containing protein [Spirillospora sp.]|nr:YbjN domain-containing protein [Spirillospora sp.]
MAFNPQASSQPFNDALARSATMVQQVLVSIGVDPDQSRLSVNNGYGWNFRYGSAIIEVYIHRNEEGSYFQVLSPIIHLPQGGLLPLYRRMLELNLQLTNAALGVYHDTVYVFSERPLDGLDPVEVNSTISRVAAYADDLDNRLVAEFGGRLYARG